MTCFIFSGIVSKNSDNAPHCCNGEKMTAIPVYDQPIINNIEDIFRGEPNYPQCCFFEEFPSSPDPDETFYGELFCHMKNDQDVAEICKGDYLKCPLTWNYKNKHNK